MQVRWPVTLCPKLGEDEGEMQIRAACRQSPSLQLQLSRSLVGCSKSQLQLRLHLQAGRHVALAGARCDRFARFAGLCSASRNENGGGNMGCW